jgi:hypothetical protein
VAILVTVIGVSIAAFVQDRVFQYTVQVNDVWRHDNLAAPYEFAIRKAPEVLADERMRIRQETPPVYRRVQDAARRTRIRHDSLLVGVRSALAFRARYVADRTRGRLEEARLDSLRYDSVRASLRLPLLSRQWNLLSAAYIERVPGLAQSRGVRFPGQPLESILFAAALETALGLERIGVLDVAPDSLLSLRVAVRDDATRQERQVDRSAVRGMDEALRDGRLELERRLDGWSDTTAIAAVILSLILEPSLRFDAEATREAWRGREEGISETAGIVRQNETIVRRGDVINEDIRQRLISLEREEVQRRGSRLGWGAIFGQVILALCVYLIFYLYLYLLRRPIYEDNRMVLLLGIMFTGIVVMFAIALRLAALDMFVVPVAIVAILLTVIFDSRVAIFALLTLTLLGALYLNLDFRFALATLFAGSLGVFSVKDIRNRSQFFVSAGLVYVGYATVLFGAYLLQGSPPDRLLEDLVLTGINAVLILLAYPLLWVFERAFDLTTDLTLLELSDMNRPLLKELSMRAPGTFNHILQVANLAESAAAAVGANALLTRVGALYHDIGKLVKPEYFVENQRAAANPHDQLKPRMSALIIASHVKEGIEIGLRHRLPQRVLDFIPMHHGTTRIEYFYQRAVAQHKKGDAPIQESEFRYPGPRPGSKETAILMLADTVEAACRTIDNPTHRRLEGMVETLVEARRADGQLDETDLTFQDLTVIRKTFLNLLLGTYHVRVKYPGQAEEAGETDSPAGGDEAPAAKPAKAGQAGESRGGDGPLPSPADQRLE